MPRPGRTYTVGATATAVDSIITDADQLMHEPRARDDETAHRASVHLPTATATAHGGCFRFLFLDDFFFFNLVRLVCM